MELVYGRRLSGCIQIFSMQAPHPLLSAETAPTTSTLVTAVCSPEDSCCVKTSKRRYVGHNIGALITTHTIYIYIYIYFFFFFFVWWGGVLIRAVV